MLAIAAETKARCVVVGAFGAGGEIHHHYFGRDWATLCAQALLFFLRQVLHPGGMGRRRIQLPLRSRRYRVDFIGNETLEEEGVVALVRAVRVTHPLSIVAQCRLSDRFPSRIIIDRDWAFLARSGQWIQYQYEQPN